MCLKWCNAKAWKYMYKPPQAPVTVQDGKHSMTYKANISYIGSIGSLEHFLSGRSVYMSIWGPYIGPIIVSARWTLNGLAFRSTKISNMITYDMGTRYELLALRGVSRYVTVTKARKVQWSGDLIISRLTSWNALISWSNATITLKSTFITWLPLVIFCVSSTLEITFLWVLQIRTYFFQDSKWWKLPIGSAEVMEPVGRPDVFKCI